MPRAARLDATDLLQHVIVRGVERCDIFGDDNDRSRFVASLSKLIVQTGTECLAWSLMCNHVHLLLRPRQTLLAPVMRRLLTGYAVYYNLRHHRSGHLFQNRYKSIVCEEESYLLELIRYIHLNPLRAGVVSDLAALDRYPWAGHAVVMGNGCMEGQMTDEVLALFGKRKREAREKYRQFVADGVAMGKRAELGSSRRITKDAIEELGGESYDARVLGSGDFVRELRQRRELEEQMPRTIEIGTIVARVCGHYGIEAAELRENNRGAAIAAARSVICYLAVRRAGYNGVEVGKQVNLQRSGVSVAAGRGEKIVLNEPALLEMVNK